MRRLSVSLKPDPAMRVGRVSVGSQQLVYVLVQDRKHSYRHGRSRVVYIGTTRTGATRIAQSAANWAPVILRSRGVRSFEARVITCPPRRNVKTWRKLEDALRLTFREIHGEVPKFNTRGRVSMERDEFELFPKGRLKRILEDLA